jgi:hypothetical protein
VEIKQPDSAKKGRRDDHETGAIVLHQLQKTFQHLQQSVLKYYDPATFAQNWTDDQVIVLIGFNFEFSFFNAGQSS